MSNPRYYRNIKEKLIYINKGSKSSYLSNSSYYRKLQEVAEERAFETSQEDNQCQEMATTLRKLYDINNIVKNSNYSYNISKNIERLDNIIYDYYLEAQEKELASAVKNEFECVKRNNEATSKYDYNQAYNNSRVSSLYNIFQGNENKAKEEDIDKSNSNIVNSYSKSYSNLDTLNSLYQQSSDYSLKNSIENNYRSIFRYLIQNDNNSAISRSLYNDSDFDYAINDLNNVISNYNRYSSNYSSSDYSIKSTLDQNMNNLKEKKINFYIRNAKEYLNNKSYSSAKSYIDKAYNTAYNYGKPTSYITDYRKIIYNAESDYYNSEGKKCFEKKIIIQPLIFIIRL